MLVSLVSVTEGLVSMRLGFGSGWVDLVGGLGSLVSVRIVLDSA